MFSFKSLTRAMNVRNQTSRPSVTDSCPFEDCSCQFVYGPKNVQSTTSCQIQTFQDNLKAYFGQFSTRFQFFLFELMVTKTRVETLYSCSIVFLPIRNISPHTSSHDLPCRKIKLSQSLSHNNLASG